MSIMDSKHSFSEVHFDHPSLEIGRNEEEKSLLARELSPSPRRPWNLITITLLVCSNLFLGLLLLRNKTSPFSCTPQEAPSPFAGLVRDSPRQWHGNIAVSKDWWDELWEKNSSYNAGVVALDYSFAREMDLPRAQRWPWDDAKGVYVLNGFHNLHCVRMLRDALEEFREGREQTSPWGHVQHCLLTMRDEVLCNADDTPRYTGYQPDSSSAYGQYRMCRDWSKLEEWARNPERAGCWRPYAEGEDGGATGLVDRYRYCREDNKYRNMSLTMWSDEPVKRTACPPKRDSAEDVGV